MYTCPMHLEIRQEVAGRCPKCGMELVLESELNNTENLNNNEMTVELISWKSYFPLFTIVGLILLVALTISLNDFNNNTFGLNKLLKYFMAGFFVVFAGFKLIDLKGFAQGYFTYDLLAKNWFGYGYISIYGVVFWTINDHKFSS